MFRVWSKDHLTYLDRVWVTSDGNPCTFQKYFVKDKTNPEGWYDLKGMVVIEKNIGSYYQDHKAAYVGDVFTDTYGNLFRIIEVSGGFVARPSVVYFDHLDVPTCNLDFSVYRFLGTIHERKYQKGCWRDLK